MSTDGVNKASTDNFLYNTLTKKQNAENTDLSVDSFLQLIAAQLSNQDPLNPTSETDFMGQMAQFTALQATQDLSLQTSVSYGASLVGKEVTAAKILANGDMVKSEGVVSGVSFFEGAPVIYIEGEAYWLDQIMAVGSLPEPPKTEGKTTVETIKAVAITEDSITATAEVSKASMDMALKTLLEKAEEESATPLLAIEVTALRSAKIFVTELPASSIKELSEKEGELRITSKMADIEFDADALEEISKKMTGDDFTLTVSKVEKSDLTESQKETAGDAIVLDLALKSGGEEINDFKNGKAEVTVPYTLEEGEDPEDIDVYFINADGSLTKADVEYDEETKTITFETGNF